MTDLGHNRSRPHTMTASSSRFRERRNSAGPLNSSYRFVSREKTGWGFRQEKDQSVGRFLPNRARAGSPPMTWMGGWQPASAGTWPGIIPTAPGQIPPQIASGRLVDSLDPSPTRRSPAALDPQDSDCPPTMNAGWFFLFGDRHRGRNQVAF